MLHRTLRVRRLAEDLPREAAGRIRTVRPPRVHARSGPALVVDDEGFPLDFDDYDEPGA
ncbi:hypothetical protein [Xylanimonas ulmi]|nr:hypothetical protein [Xylanibacterium ulmi]